MSKSNMFFRITLNYDTLAAEIVSKLSEKYFISKTDTFLDPALGGGQLLKALARRLNKHGHSIENIRSRLFGYEDSIAYLNHPINKSTAMIAQLSVVEYGKTTMKNNNFDVVLGNYPFGDAKDYGGTLWGPFANNTFENLVKKSGTVAVIHPPSFIGKHTNESTGKSDYSCFSKNQIHQLHIFDTCEKDKYFKGVGTKACWYIAEACEPYTDTTIVGYDNGTKTEFNVDFNKQTFLPSVINDLSISIHQKIVKLKGMDFNQTRKLHYYSMKKRNQVSDTRTKEYEFKSHFSHQITRYSNYKMKDYDSIKVMVPQTSTLSKSFIDSKCNVSEDLFYINCVSNKDAEIKLNYLTSNFVKYIGKNYRPGRNLGALLQSSIIPNTIDMSIFSKKEIDYIEANAK
jgi:hypothetical protein